VTNDLLIFVVFFLLPGGVLEISARKLVEWNARSFPRLYGPAQRVGACFVYRVVGMAWIVLGFVSFVLHK